MPRKSAEEAAQTRAAVVAEACQQLSVAGVAGTSLAAIAERLGMSKAGVVGPFGSRDALVAEALESAVDTFTNEVVAPAVAVASHAERLHVLVESWIAYLTDSPFDGGCVLTSASSELDGRTGRPRERVRAVTLEWHAFLRTQLTLAEEAGHPLPSSPVDVAATLVGLAMALNQAIQLLHDDVAARRLGELMRRAAGLHSDELGSRQNR